MARTPSKFSARTLSASRCCWVSELQPELLEGFEGQEQAAGLAGEGAKAVTLVEGLGALVLGIDDDCVDGDRRGGAQHTADSVEQ